MPNELKIKDSDADFSELLKEFDNDFTIFSEVVEVYIANYPRQISHIEKCLKVGDSEQVRKAVHTLKGAASNFSRTLLTPIAAQMEDLAQDGKISEAEKLFPELQSQAAELKKRILEFMTKGKSL